MCNPAAAVMVASMVFTAYSANEQGKSQRSIARFNARQAENEAVRTRNKGVEEEIKHRRQVAQLQSRQKVQLAASNVDFTKGSASELLEDTQLFGEVDSLRIRSNFEDRATALEDSGQLINFQGDAAATAGRNQAVGSLLSAAGTGIQASGVSSQWYNPNSSAVTTTTTGAQANAAVGAIA